MAASRVEGLLKIAQFQLRNLTLRPLLCSKLHTSAGRPATFSITRELWGKTPAEIEEEKGIPEPPRETIYHCMRDIKGSPTKFNMVAKQIRGLPIDEAIKQMTFSPKRAAGFVKQVVEEARVIAQEKHGIEDNTYLWIAQSFASKGRYIKKIRYHAKGRRGLMHKKYCHYFLVLQEGSGAEKNKRRQKKHLTELERIQRHPQHIRNSLSWW
ncbi:54S ribosomal protein L22, mitochondrial [Desmophyllum pertusum]|uniref:Large ribosomal subunit protein uL22m n=1 Tax=Desmophyllum pertusum TaxID=174260 RepID=A0A9W9ZNX5_9CNID|nr:54S ribosomal protein L22, mitochondrial [Desmophyllum pertusum]